MYRIGELANLANVSKRTIDYYTNIGLLKAHRSKSNYRIYTQKAIDDLKFIEECKNLHYPLEEIKRKLEMKQVNQVQEGELKKHIQSITTQLKQLRKEMQVLIPLVTELNCDGEWKMLKTECETLMNSLSKINN